MMPAAVAVAPESGPPHQTASAEPPSRLAGGGSDVIGLPTGTARLMSTWMASLAAVATAWLLGSPVIDVDAVAEFGIAALLLFLAVRLGLRAQLVLGLALGCGLVLGVLSIFGYGVVIVVIVGWAAFFVVLLRHARVALTRGVLFTAIAVLCGVTWAAPAVLGILSAVGAGLDLVVATLVALATWTFSAAGRRARLRTGARLTVVRDAVFQVLALAAVSLGALWLGTTTETTVSRFAVGTPFESLAPTAGWFVLILTLVALGWSAMRLPRWVVAAQMHGRIESRVTGEVLLFVTFACLGAFVSWRLDGADAVVGRACVVALAAGATYVIVRTRYATPLPLPNYALWVMPLDGSARVRSTAATVAAQWRVGQVTVLADPASALTLAGEHLRAAAMTGVAESLFPTRPVHLQDWLEAQPAAWRSLPLRELYTTPELRAKVLADLRPGTRVLALTSGRIPTRFQAFNDDQRALKTGVVGFLLPLSQATTMQLNSLALGNTGGLESLSGERAIKARLREVRPAKASVRVRHIVLQCAPADLDLAEDIASRIHGATDAQGRIVECWVASHQSGTSAMLRLVRLPGGVWRHAMLFALELFEPPSAPWSPFRLYVALLRRVLGSGWHGDFEVVVVESGTPGTLIPIGTLTGVVERGAVQPVIALRHSAALGSLTYSATLYRGEILLPDGRGQEFAVAHAVQKLLATECQSITVARPVDPVPVIATVDESPIVESAPAESPAVPAHADSSQAEPQIQNPWSFARRALPVLGTVATFILIGYLGYRDRSNVNTAAPAGSTEAPGRAAVAEAVRRRDLNDYTGVVDVLTGALASERNEQLRAVMLRDRAYAYKLLGRWTESIADLTASPDNLPNETVSRRADRAYAEMRARDVDAALQDYRRLEVTQTDLDRVEDLIKPTQSPYFFVYLSPRAMNGPWAMPDEMARLSGKWPRVNLRFWWYPVLANEVRYTEPGDETEAKTLVAALREEGLTIGDPVRLSSDIKRNRRIEVWLVKRKEVPPSVPPAVNRPAGAPRIPPPQSKQPYGKSDQGPPPSKK